MIDALSKIHGDVWAITPDAHRTLADKAALMARSNYLNDAEHDAVGSLVIGGIQHVHVKGVLVPSCPLWAETFGFCSVERVRIQLETAAMRPDVDGVLISYDTPGGYLPGIPGLADMLASFRKPIVGYVSGSCASAGYWLACSQTLYAEREAAVGSIGVYLTLQDSSQLFAMSGLRTILVSTGKYKGVGDLGTELTEDYVEHIRQDVIAPMGELFFEHVQGWRALNENLLDGRAWRGKQSLALGLIDAVGTLSDAIDELTAIIKQEKEI